MTMTGHKTRAIAHADKTEGRKERKRTRRAGIADKRRFAAWNL